MDNLPVELVLEIVESCPRNDLPSLCLTARFLYAIGNPILYKHVDLSIHNRGQVMIRPTDGFSQSSDSYWCTQVPAGSLLRQESFIAAVLGNPGLATLVKSFTWTLLRPHTKELIRNPLLGITPPGAISRRAILRIWDAFHRLTGVETLDLAWLSRDHGDPLADGYSNGLFPAAISIRLSGVMHYSFAASILYNNPAKLEHLELDNLQQVGKGCDHFLYRRTNHRQDYQQRPSVWNSEIRRYGSLLPFGSAGPMQNLLGPLIGRCPNLRALTLRKVGQRYHTEFPIESQAKDEDLYHEFALFINSVKHTLRHVVFEQGERTGRPPPPAAGQIVGQFVGQPFAVWPMDRRFMNILYPRLFQGHWPCLESMTVGGVHFRWTNDLLTIRGPRRGDVRAVARRNVQTMDHIGLGDPLAGVIR